MNTAEAAELVERRGARIQAGAHGADRVREGSDVVDVGEGGAGQAKHLLRPLEKHGARCDVARRVVVLDHGLRHPDRIGRRAIEHQAVGRPGLILGHDEQPGHVLGGGVHDTMEHARHARPNETEWGRHHLLNAAKLSRGARDGLVPEVVIVDADLLVKLLVGVRRRREEAEHHAIAVAEEVASDDVAAGVQALELGGEQQMRRAEHAGGEDEPPGAQGERATRLGIQTLDVRQALAIGDEATDDGARAKLESPLKQRRQHVRGDVVLRTDRARVGIARRARDAARALSVVGVVDGERQSERVEPHLPRGVRDETRCPRQRRRRLRVGSAAWRVGGVFAARSGDVEDPLGARVVRLELRVIVRPPRARVGDDLGIRLEVGGAKAERNATGKDGLAADAVERADGLLGAAVPHAVGSVHRIERRQLHGAVIVPVLGAALHPRPTLQHQHALAAGDERCGRARAPESASDDDRVVGTLAAQPSTSR